MPLDPNDIQTYDYELPESLIAKHPPVRREDARLMVLDRENESISHHSISDIPQLLQAGDCLVLNDTRVLAARLIGHRTATGGKWEGLYLEERDGFWQLIGQTRGRLQTGETITVDSIHSPELPPLTLQLLDRNEDGFWQAVPEIHGTPIHQPAVEILAAYGTMPLPPYMDRTVASESDFERYQTTYGVNPGSVAAPTAGLHFTPSLLSRCEDAGIAKAAVTLHVGVGTFRPVGANKLTSHHMHSEWCSLNDQAADTLNQSRATQGRLVAVGTTSVRTLESAASELSLNTGTPLRPWSGKTELFIRPPYQFKAVDCLLTNFHLPKSTLLVLVSALAGIEFVRQAYQAAIAEQYRFYSYGDAMLII